MFTGIIEEAGSIASLGRNGTSLRMAVRCSTAGAGVRLGDSLAVNGCCLTVVKVARTRSGTILDFDLLEETWRKTSFSTLAEGGLVNLERSLRADARLGGHFVTGHVDGTGEIIRWEPSGSDYVLDLRPPRDLMRYFVEKGSVAVDGISLTVAGVTDASIRAWIIPHTWKTTSLRERVTGDFVNLEADLLGKYVERFIEARASSSARSRRPSSSKAR